MNLSGFEFFKFVMEKSSSKLRLPERFAKLLQGREPHNVKLHEVGGGLWDMEVVSDKHGHIYLGRAWEHFARAYKLEPCHLLLFSYDGVAVFTIKVFNGTYFRMHYHTNESGSIEISNNNDSSEFFVIIMEQTSLDKLRLPERFSKLLQGNEVKLREVGSGLLDMEVVSDKHGHIYLRRGWEQFSRAKSLELGYLIFFSYDGVTVLTAKVFDNSTCPLTIADNKGNMVIQISSGKELTEIRSEEELTVSSSDEVLMEICPDTIAATLRPKKLTIRGCFSEGVLCSSCNIQTTVCFHHETYTYFEGERTYVFQQGLHKYLPEEAP